MTHTIAACSGIGSGRNCSIIPWSDKRTKAMQFEYPFVGGRTPSGMRWVAVLFADGTVDTYPKSRVTPYPTHAELA